MIRRVAKMAALLAALASSVAYADAGPHATAPATAAVRSPGVVNLNDASEDELTRLPGIGPAKARAIVERRHGHPFRKLDELTKVKGIGRKTFGRLRPYITLVGATTLKEDVKLHR